MVQQTEDEELESVLAALAHPAEMPAPEARNRLRNVSELGVVRIKEGGEMLLPGALSGDRGAARSPIR